MLLVRALNDFDILSNLLENGIASKKLIYNLTKSNYENSKDKEFHNLNDQEKDIFIKEHMKTYIKNHR